MPKEDKIVFIYPKIKTMPSAKTFAPQAFLYIAASLEQNGYKTELIDTRINADYHQLLDKALSGLPLYVGITAMTGYQVRYGLQIAKHVKGFNKDIPVVWGGLHGSLCPEDVLSSGYVDLVAIGEGEELAVVLADNFSAVSKGNLDKIDGLAYRKNGKAHFTKKRDFISVDKIPLPAWHLIKEQITNYIVDDSIDILTSRGCPHRCRFCYNDTYHARFWRGRSPEHVMKEVDWLKSNVAMPIKRINFVDDNFFTDRKRAIDICSEVKRRNLKMHADLRCNYIS